MDFPSHNDFLAIAKQAGKLTPGTKIDPAMYDVPGAEANVDANIVAAVADEVIRHLAISDAGRYLDSCDGGAKVGQPVGPQLARWAFDGYGLTSNPAAAAIGFVAMSRPTAAAGAGTVPNGTRIQAVRPGLPPQIFTLTDDVSFGVAALTGQFGASLNLPVQATTTGVASGVAANAQWSFVDQPFDPTITIANAQAIIGADAEDSVQFTTRVRGFFTASQKGTLIAIDNGALSLPLVAQAIAIEVTNTLQLPAGLTPADAALVQAAIGTQIPARFVQLYIGTKSGSSNLALIQAVQLALLGFRAAGIYVQVIGAAPQTVYVVIQGVSIPAGVNAQAVESTIAAAVTQYINSLNPGDTLLVSSIHAAALAAGTQAKIPLTVQAGPNAGQSSVLIGTSPNNLSALDLAAVSPNQVFRTIASNITVTG